jgi:glycogen operon protein
MTFPTERFGAFPEPGGVRFAAWSGTAKRVWVAIFDWLGRETERLEMMTAGDGTFLLVVPGLKPGTRYGLRADGRYDPQQGFWFDPNKLLVDPYAVAIDRPYAYDPRLAMPRGQGADTASLMPKAIVTELPPVLQRRKPVWSTGGLIYEANVRALTMRHADVPERQRGTIAALAHPAIVAHLKKIGVTAIELMPVVAWIDERHLPPLGLRNAWGYNPVTFKPLDPRLAPGGIAELRAAVAALHEAGIGVILDLVFNHTGESDDKGPTLSLRGLDNRSYYAHGENDPGQLINDTGTGNTVACGGEPAAALVLDALRHFVLYAGVDGFRFDLAPVLGRIGRDYSRDAALLKAILADPVLGDRILIAEPWDIGPNGYQLGNFPPPFLEWNDRFRDDVRRFWRGDAGTVGALATRLSGSSDVFRREGLATTRGVNFIAAHDGFSLADIVAYENKHNEANGEENRDGHNDNISWNNGVEGDSADPAVIAGRRLDLEAMLSTLFASRGAIMLTAGDEFGRTQRGNNNAYPQDNDITWLDWANRDREVEDHVAALAAFRMRSRLHGEGRFLDGAPPTAGGFADVDWLTETGAPMRTADWEDPRRHRLIMMVAVAQGRVAIAINGDRRAGVFLLPKREGFRWLPAAGTDRNIQRRLEGGMMLVAGRSVLYFAEEAAERQEGTP